MSLKWPAGPGVKSRETDSHPGVWKENWCDLRKASEDLNGPGTPRGGLGRA